MNRISPTRAVDSGAAAGPRPRGRRLRQRRRQERQRHSPSTAASSPKLAAATLNGSGATFPQAYYETVISEFQTAEPAVTVTYDRRWLGQGPDRPAGRARAVGRFGQPVKPEEKSRLQGRRSSTSRRWRRRSRSRTTSRASTSCSSRRTRSPGSSRARSRSGTTRRSRPTTPTPTCRTPTITVAHRSDGSGTTSNFTKYLTLGRRRRVDARRRTRPSPGPTSSAGRERQRRRGPDRQGHRRRHRLRRLLRRQGGRADRSPSIKNADGKFVAADARRAPPRRWPARRSNADLTYDPLNAGGADAYPITAPTYILAYTTQTDAAVGNALKALPQVHLRRRPGPAPSRWTSPSCPTDLLEQGQGAARQDHGLASIRPRWGRARCPPPLRLLPHGHRHRAPSRTVPRAPRVASARPGRSRRPGVPDRSRSRAGCSCSSSWR